MGEFDVAVELALKATDDDELAFCSADQPVSGRLLAGHRFVWEKHRKL
jgi:hypothetical protein